ncbi:GNAT family N-acetyltransferase [Brachybacterium phenoliresistens]|uniref:Acyl-CoA synthetase n=1 Tax=Brachybacterium phenoliresistens TaxID=396014 RepID=Z9JWY0_9MICO|nr:GNAT family N-acetyltransferase [Brachybacterium phenoliresistens]EWS82880.1 acyl-CoA synthetase [Brachybacterium phenoliresistens]
MAPRRDAGTGRRSTGAPDPAHYPAHWEADIALRDGTAAHLRPILPTDADALQRFHQAQSEQSRYLRFFAAMPRLSPRDLDRFTRVDHHDRVAFVVLHEDDIIAVGRYDRIGGREAEVAFNVADSQQGQGLASILLEHLAAAAREHGIDTFTAEVLPQNQKMIGVFTDAGFDVRRTFDDGVVQVVFRIDPTARSLAVMAERERRVEARAMERMLHPSSVLVVGISSRADSAGRRILDALDRSGYDGVVHVVAREDFEIAGHPTRARIADVPGPIDVAVIALRPEACLEAVDDCARIGVRCVVIPTEGFSDSAVTRADLQRRLVARVRRHGMRLLGPGALGYLRTGEHPINASLSPRLPRAGRAALAAQSSALAAMLLAATDRRGTGVHEFVAAGNRADVSLNDCLQHWDESEDVGVIGLALESMGNPRKFTRIARRLTRTRPVVVLRPPGVGSQAPPGHDVRASVLPRRALDQVLSAAGVVRADNVDHLMDLVDALERQGVPLGARVGLLSNTAALGEALRGAADRHRIRVSADNRSVPLAEDPRLVQRAFTSMAGLGGVDLVVAAVLDPLTGDLVSMLRAMATVARGSEVALVVCLVTDRDRWLAVEEAVRADGTLPPVHTSPAAAMRAAAGLLAAARRSAVDDAPPERPADIDVEAARTMVRELLPERPGAPRALSGQQVRDLLAAYGIGALPTAEVHDVDQALQAAGRIGYPLALKSTDPVLRHRTDLGGVRLDIADPAQLAHAFTRMRAELSYSDAPLELQRMAPPGVPVVIRSTEDPALGPVVSFSVAGDATDLLDDIAYAIPPLGPQVVERLMSSPATAAKLRGDRGMPHVDRAALADLLARVGVIAEDLPELRRLELYPVVVGLDGVKVVGASAEVAHAPNRTDGTRRILSGPGSDPLRGRLGE